MTQLEVLNEELENLTREADLLLGEVIKCRASYPGFLAEMKREECRNKFIRTLEAPLKSARPLGIDVEKIKSDVTRRVEESQRSTEMNENFENEQCKLKAEHGSCEERYRKLLELIRSGRYAPIDALPSDFALQLTNSYS
ncbi:hypothetical protein COOONC_23458 [Cooperia oncophora]